MKNAIPALRDGDGRESAPLDRAVGKARRRLMPFLVLMYVIAFIDRANVGFAREGLRLDAGIDDAAFAFGAGVFFLGYAVFEVPSNLALYRVGARRWLGRIMISWGLVAAALALTRGPVSFYMLRLLLGIAEAGFFPGIIFFLSQWFPARARGQTMGFFYFGLPLALVIGGPLCGVLLDLHAPFGWRPWQFMFVVEGLLASAVGVAALFYLTDRPTDAQWLDGDERAALAEAMAREDAAKRATGPASLRRAVGDQRVIAFCLVYFALQLSVYGVIFYLPTRIAELLGSKVGVTVGLLSAIPWLAAIAGVFAVTRIADRNGRHRQLAAAMLALAAVGMAASTATSSVAPALLAFSLAAAGFVTAQPLFWTLPTGYLSGVAAAGTIGLINAIGNLGGFVAPNIKALAERWSGNPAAGMWLLALFALTGAAGLLGLRDNRRSE